MGGLGGEAQSWFRLTSPARQGPLAASSLPTSSRRRAGQPWTSSSGSRARTLEPGSSLQRAPPLGSTLPISGAPRLSCRQSSRAGSRQAACEQHPSLTRILTGSLPGGRRSPSQPAPPPRETRLSWLRSPSQFAALQHSRLGFWPGLRKDASTLGRGDEWLAGGSCPCLRGRLGGSPRNTRVLNRAGKRPAQLLGTGGVS